MRNYGSFRTAEQTPESAQRLLKKTRLLGRCCVGRRGCSLSVIRLNSLVMCDSPLYSENQAAVTNTTHRHKQRETLGGNIKREYKNLPNIN